VDVSLVRYDWMGRPETLGAPHTLTLAGASDGVLNMTLPPTKVYGAYTIVAKCEQDGESVGQMLGRYVVIPPRTRPRTVPSPFAETTFGPITTMPADYQRRLGAELQAAGLALRGSDLATTLRSRSPSQKGSATL
jgi:hypothetical protein